MYGWETFNQELQKSEYYTSVQGLIRIAKFVRWLHSQVADVESDVFK
jgi:hypothetical protein